MERPVERAELGSDGVPQSGHVGRVGDVELEDRRFGRELASGALREPQTPAGAGEDDLGTLLLCELGDPERQRRVGQHAGDEDLLAIEHATSGLLRFVVRIDPVSDRD